jgi:glyoxylase-like metal-dependent hydrolase (beta-lactamase superfamily II)
LNVADLSETELRDNVWAWTLGGDRIEASYGANCTAVAGRKAVLLVDPLIAPAHARLVDSALRTKTRLPVRFVVLTHHHTDRAVARWLAGGGVIPAAALAAVLLLSAAAPSAAPAFGAGSTCGTDGLPRTTTSLPSFAERVSTGSAAARGFDERVEYSRGNPRGIAGVFSGDEGGPRT